MTIQQLQLLHPTLYVAVINQGIELGYEGHLPYSSGEVNEIQEHLTAIAVRHLGCQGSYAPEEELSNWDLEAQLDQDEIDGDIAALEQYEIEDEEYTESMLSLYPACPSCGSTIECMCTADDYAEIFDEFNKDEMDKPYCGEY